MAGRDITEGSSGVYSLAEDGLPIARGYTDIGITSSSALWANTDVAYDVALGGLPFLYAINDQRPYTRQTAPFKKDQFDNAQDPGEQSLTGWWIRSQSSFHHGSGINFYDPATGGDVVTYRFKDSRNVNVWEKGQVTLLRQMNTGHVTTTVANSKPRQKVRSIQWAISGTTYDGVLLHDGWDVDKVKTDGTVTHFIDYNTGTAEAVYAICDDGTYAYWVTNAVESGANKLHMYKKPLSGSAADTSDETLMFKATGTVITNAVIEYTKERIILCVNNSVYEVSPSATALPTPLYTHPRTGYLYTAITSSGSSIYVSGFNGVKSVIHRYTLTTTGGLPTITSAITSAEMPIGEVIYSMYYYLGVMMIGTSRGVRAAFVADVDGTLSYGPLIVETTQPCYDFAGYNHYVWCATGVNSNPGTIRIDIGVAVETLRYAFANDVFTAETTGHRTTGVAFLGNTDRVAYCTEAINQSSITYKEKTGTTAKLTTSTAHSYAVGDAVYIDGVGSPFDGAFTVTGVPTSTTFTYTTTTGTVSSTAVSPAGICTVTGNVYVEDASIKASEGYLTTGNIRFNTLEPKHFERLLGRGDFSKGSMILITIAPNGTEYDHITYTPTINSVEVTTEPPSAATEYIAYKFEMYRDATDTTAGPILKGYQAKALIATPRHRIIQFPLYCFDVETDRYNTVVGYEGRAIARILAAEQMEENGDIVTWQDFTTNESYQVVIESAQFTRTTPPDKRFSGFGGILTLQLRTV